MKGSGAFGLFVKGLRWSYREYGAKGVVAFAVAALVVYYVLDREVAGLFED